MGSFGGHVLPGTFFIIFGLWWSFQSFNRYFSCRRRNARFTSSVTFPCSCLCGRMKDWPIEPVVKIVFTLIGICIEITFGFDKGKFVYMGNGQHATMFFFFALSGIMDLLVHFRAPVPPDSDYVILTMAVLVEGLLFKFHLHGRRELDVLVHMLLLYVIAAAVILLLAEMRYRHNILSPLARAYLVLLQGTWFWQVAFILYNPAKDAVEWKDSHDNTILATLYFAWHGAANFIIILLIGMLVHCIHRVRGYRPNDDDVAMKRLIHTSANGQTVVSLNDDSESDLEFERPARK